jgi:hypothetical protein
MKLGSGEAGKLGGREAVRLGDWETMEFGLRPIGAGPTPRRELGMRNAEG